jgi:tetratricopeptide (TPR) repeat protein
MKLPRERRWLVPAGLCLLVIAVYANGLGGGFSGDSRGLILADTRVHDASAENLGLIFTHTYWWPYGESGLYRPFTTLSYLFNYAILGNGQSPTGYHVVNLLLHCANVLLVYVLARRLTGQVWLAASVAAIWGVHPVLTESVTNLAGRPDLLAGLCVLSGFLFYLDRRWFALAAVTLVGAFSKESAVTLLGIVVLYELCFGSARNLLWPCVAILIPIQVMLFFRGAALYGAPPVEFPFWDNPLVGSDFVTGRITALYLVARYAALLVWPARLSSDYSFAQIVPALYPVGWLVLAMVPAALYLAWRKNRMAFFLFGAALLTWLPSSNLLFPIGTIMAERFLYLPAIAFAAGIVALASRAPRWTPVIAGVIVLALSARTIARNPDWQSDLTLGAAAVQASPESYKAHKLYANALFESHAPVDQVLAEAEKSLAILAPLPDLRNNADTWRRAAEWYRSKGDPASVRRALELLQRCMTIVGAQEQHARTLPRFDPATDPLATARADVSRLISAAYLQLGDPRQALSNSAQAIELDPDNPDVYRQYARSLAASGRNEDAVVTLMEGVLLTVDAGLRQSVVEMYRAGLDPHGCALLPGQDGRPALNPACDTVRKHLCAATDAAVEVREKGDRHDQAVQLRAMGERNFGCPAK